MRHLKREEHLLWSSTFQGKPWQLFIQLQGGSPCTWLFPKNNIISGHQLVAIGVRLLLLFKFVSSQRIACKCQAWWTLWLLHHHDMNGIEPQLWWEFVFLQKHYMMTIWKFISLNKLYVLVALFFPICDIYSTSNLRPQCYHVGANRVGNI